MMSLTISTLHADPPRLDDVIDVVANLEGRIRLDSDGSAIYQEIGFPVAELAVALAQWSKDPVTERRDFAFNSMSAEEPGLIWIRRVDDGWRVGSIHQERAELQTLKSPEVDAFIDDYITQLLRQVETAFGREASACLVEALQPVA